jgi:hypothetical protein
MSTLVYAKVVENSTAKDIAYAVMTRQLRYSYIQLLCSILALCFRRTCEKAENMVATNKTKR